VGYSTFSIKRPRTLLFVYESAKQLLYALGDHVLGMKIIALEECADFATLDTKKLFSKLKFHKLSHKGSPNHAASLTSKALITSACVGGHDANPTNTVSSTLEFGLSSLAAASDEQYESIPDDEIALLARKFDSSNMYDCPKRKKFDSTNKYDYTNQNNSSNKGDHKKKNRIEDKKKKFQKIMS
jgi:hypothetical protein